MGSQRAGEQARDVQGDGRFLVNFKDCFCCNGLMWTGKQSWSRNFSVQHVDIEELYFRETKHSDSFIAN